MTPLEKKPQHEREHDEPDEGSGAAPMVVMILAALLAAFGAIYIARADFDNPAAWGDGRDSLELRGATGSAAGATVDGAAVFASRCAACHQANGAGLPGVFPPLAGSEWVTGDEATLLAILLHGVNGPLTVNGVVFNGSMPAFGKQSSDEEIAAVATFIRSQWGNTAGPVAPAAVITMRQETSERAEPFNGDADLGTAKK